MARTIEVLSATMLVLGGLALSEVPMAAAATSNLTGVVYQSNGTPAANTGVSAGEPGVSCCQNTSTDSNGNYAFSLADGTWNVTVNPPSGDTTDAQTSVTVVISSGTVTSVNGVSQSGGPVDITLQVATLTGVVYQSNGNPAANTGVSAGEPGVSCCQNTSTNQSGDYAFALADGTWSVGAYPPSGDTTDAQTSVTVVISSGAVTSVNGVSQSGGPVDITLQVANLAGVVYESDGTPAANTGVSAGEPATGFCCQNTGTNQSGYYAFALADGTWNITASPPMGDTTDAQTSVTVVISSGAVTSVNGVSQSGGPVDITLQVASYNLTGVVYESDGTPAANTGVSASPSGGGSCCQNTSTNPSGDYAFALADGTWSVTASPPSGDTTDASTSVTITVSGGAVTDCTGVGCGGTLPAVNITLQVANLTGIVYESDGTPAANSGVSAGEPAVSCCQNTSTNSTGNYAMALTDGTWSVGAYPPSGDATDAQTSVTVTISGGVVTGCTGTGCGGTLPTVDITLQKANLTGIVYESNGTSAPVNAMVSAGEPSTGFCCQSTSTNPSGDYAFALADGTWNVTASPPSGDSTDAPTSVTITISSGVVTGCTGAGCGGTLPTVDITLQKANLTGIVYESNGTPAANTGVGAGNSTGPGMQSTNTNQSGDYVFALTDGTWIVTANPPSGDTTDASTSVTVTVSGGLVTSCTGIACGGTLPSVNIDLEVSGAISGTVTDYTSSVGLQGICVSAFPIDGGYIGSTDTGTGGSYAIGNLAPGNYDVEFGPTGLCPGGSAGDYPAQYYEGASSVSSATPVTVNPGAVTSDIDAAMGSPFPPAPPSGSVSSASGTSINPSGTATATNDGTTVAAAGEGSLTVAQYASDPVTTPGFSTPGGFLDVDVASGSDFSSVTVTDCNLNGATSLQWWTGSAWEAVSPVTGPTGNPACLTATLNSTSTPTIAELTGTVFAAAVLQVPTATTIARTSGAASVPYGSSLTFTAHVTVLSGSATPNGTVTFYDGTSAISGPVGLTGGAATFTTTTLGAGTHSISAVYSGDSHTLGSSSASIRQIVTKRATMTMVTASPDPSTVGQEVTFTATVAPPLGHGTVTFYDGVKAMSGSVSLSGGVAKFTTSSLGVGFHLITAAYGGDANTSPSLGMTVEAVAKRPSTTGLTSSANPSKAGTTVTFTVTVTPTTATGTVTFWDGGSVIGTCTLSGGKCSLSTAKLSKGTHSITAVYGGDGLTVGSSSPVLKQVVG